MFTSTCHVSVRVFCICVYYFKCFTVVILTCSYMCFFSNMCSFWFVVQYISTNPVYHSNAIPTLYKINAHKEPHAETIQSTYTCLCMCVCVFVSVYVPTSEGATSSAATVAARWGSRALLGPGDTARGPRTSSNSACSRWLDRRPSGSASNAHTVYSLGVDVDNIVH